MTIPVVRKSNFFVGALTALALLGPILLVVLVGTLPLREPRELIVNGHIFLVAVLAGALVLRGVYEMGFERARKLFVSSPALTA